MARTVAVGVGIMEYPFDTADGFWKWVDLCEAGGIDSIWQTDRMISRSPILECMTALAAIAGRTKRIKFGVNVVSVAMRDPVLLAKQCATIDVLSQGRLLPGFGIGSPRGPEWTAMHLDPKTRGRTTDEALEIIQRLWSGEKFDFDGRHFKLTGAQIAPGPVQSDLPMWIGGSSEAAIRRTAKYGTGWQSGAETPETVGQVIAGIKAATAAAGRHIDEDHYGVTVPIRIGSPDDPAVAAMRARLAARLKLIDGDPRGDLLAVGDPDDIAALFHRYVAAGVHKFVAVPIVNDAEDLLAQTELLATRILPMVEDRVPA